MRHLFKKHCTEFRGTIMKELGKKIVSYWGNRAEGYSEYNREELAGDKWQDWIAEIKKQLPKKEKSEIRILIMHQMK